MPKIVVQKYGGATLSDPEKIKNVARRIFELSKKNVHVVAAVSAMGKTTNQLIEIANSVSPHPNRRELDMLLTTGERISMALLSMALHDLGCPAISFTGSQAGILTDDSHINAKILDVKAFRIEEALRQGKVVVLAGFQGVSPVTKEITTLGRGGTDTTAVAVAAYLHADRCEILKDVAGVFTADPQLIPEAQPIKNLNFQQMMEMTFWGAKVLHHRSVELAYRKKVPLYIGPASTLLNEGTMVTNANETNSIFESSQILGLNSHERVLQIRILSTNSEQGLREFRSELERFEIPTPQILTVESNSNHTDIFVCGPAEILQNICSEKTSFKNLSLVEKNLCSISATCTGVASCEITQSILQKLKEVEICPIRIQISALNVNLFIEQRQRPAALSKLHQLVNI